MAGGDGTAFFHQLGGHFPAYHGIVVPAGLLVFDAGPEAADGTALLEAGEQVEDLLFRAAHGAGDVGIRGQGVGQVGLHDTQDGTFCFGELLGHGFLTGRKTPRL